MNPQLALQIARGAEAVSALLAALYALAQPWPPTGETAVATLIPTGAAVLTLGLAWQLGRPTRGAVVLARLLSTATIVFAIRSVFVTVEPAAGDTIARSLIGSSAPTLWFVSQLLVAISLWHARSLLPTK